MAGSEKGAAYTSLLRGLLIDRGLCGVRLLVSDDLHEGIRLLSVASCRGWTDRCALSLEAQRLGSGAGLLDGGDRL